MHGRIQPFAFYPNTPQDARIVLYPQRMAVPCDNLTPNERAPHPGGGRSGRGRFGTLAVGFIRDLG